MAKRILIVGAGAAGMMAAIQAGRLGADVTLLERNEKAGKKIYITGKGRCNLTNAAQGEDFMKRIVRNPRFLYASLAALDNNALGGGYKVKYHNILQTFLRRFDFKNIGDFKL